MAALHELPEVARTCLDIFRKRVVGFKQWKHRFVKQAQKHKALTRCKYARGKLKAFPRLTTRLSIHRSVRTTAAPRTVRQTPNSALAVLHAPESRLPPAAVAPPPLPSAGATEGARHGASKPTTTSRYQDTDVKAARAAFGAEGINGDGILKQCTRKDLALPKKM
eukprot:6178069-Pleurochrysis_carterae.AAC.2